MTTNKTKSTLYLAFRTAMIDALKIVRTSIANEETISTHFDIPEITYQKNGLPSIGKAVSKQLLDHRSVFDFAPSSKKTINKPKSWEDFYNVTIKDQRIKKLLGLEGKGFNRNKDSEFNWGKIVIEHALKSMLDYYIHTTGLTTYNSRRFIPIFQEWTNSLYQNKLRIDIFIPLPLLTFEFKNRYKLSDNCFIQKLDKDFLRSCFIGEPYSISRSAQTVLGASIYALVLTNWTIQNNYKISRDLNINNLESYEEIIMHIDHLMSSIRIVTSKEVGYGQIIAKPNGWCDAWKANLKIPKVIAVRRYPHQFEINFFQREPTKINNNELREVNQIYRILSDNTTNKLDIASKRLNSASLRIEDGDAFLDVMIGLESLLVEDSNSESTHKLALRLAALNSIEKYKDYSSEEIFEASKKLSKYRGAIVHTSKKIDKSKKIETSKRRDIPALNLGLDLLRHAIFVCSKHPELLKKNALDKHIFDTLDKQK